jgi:hypothetical protein
MTSKKKCVTFRECFTMQPKEVPIWGFILKANGTEVVGKPDEGKPHVRFDEGVLETGLN